jgi:hypothetical protein
MYIYIIKAKKHIGTDIIKVGMSSVPNLNRLSSYGKNTRYIGMAEIGNNYLAAEKRLISKFRERFALAEGREYFHVDDELAAKKIFLETVNEMMSKDLSSAAASAASNPFDRFRYQS